MTLIRSLFLALLCNSLLLAIPTPGKGQSIADFRSPPVSNRVITYWMWLNGHITKPGITKDLEAMKRAGINGTYMFSVGFYQPGPVRFMSDDWWDCMKHAMKESHRLGMTFGVYNSDGWSMSGGPWITPEESMKQLTWADTLVAGGRRVHLALPKPAMNFFYKDIAVLAYSASPNEAPHVVDRITDAHRVRNAETIVGRGLKAPIQFYKPVGGSPAHVTLDLREVQDVRRVVFDDIKNNPFLEASARISYAGADGKFIDIPGSYPLNLKAEGLLKQCTFSFAVVHARYIRISVTLEPETKKPVPLWQDSLSVRSIAIYTTPRVNLWEPKSGESKRIRHERQQVFMQELHSPVAETLPAGLSIQKDQLLDLTASVDSGGRLQWDAPPGNWVIKRVGFTSTNRIVIPATKEGRGLECNKMDARAVEKHFNAYTARIIDTSIKIIGKPVDHMQLESWEAGIQNWTAGFEEQFLTGNRYSIIPYLPILAGGHVVGSYAESDKFLWDFRNAVAQGIAENYWGTLARLARARGVTVSGEGSGMQHYLYDPMRYQQYVDVPMGEFWPNEGHVRADVKNASSVAHTYGRKYTGAEAFTSGDERLWSVKPFDLKQIGDEAFTSGANHFVLHTYVHQPYDIPPGFTLTKFGNHLQRLNPWFNHAQSWFEYLARCQYMLRQGRGVQDIAYFIGEGIPAYLGLPSELHPALPAGYDYDGVNMALISQMRVVNGKLVLPGGASYHLLVLQDLQEMTPGLIRQIGRLVADGAHVVAARPTGSPSLQPDADPGALNRLIDALWGTPAEPALGSHTPGKGKVYAGVLPATVLTQMGVRPDFRFTPVSGSATINFVHTATDSTDTYLLTNYDKKPATIRAVFRIRDKRPERWDPDRGTAIPLHVDRQGNGETVLTLPFTRWRHSSSCSETVCSKLPGLVTRNIRRRLFR